MENTRILRILLAANLLIAQLVFLSGCGEQLGQTPAPWSNYVQADGFDLPEPVLQSYEENIILVVTWFQRPFTGYFMFMPLFIDGALGRMLTSSRGKRGVSPAQLTEQDREEIRTILEAMTQISTADPLVGPEIITVSYLWRGKHYVLSFNESGCPDELDHLFEIADAAWRRPSSSHTNPPWNPCRESDEDQRQVQESTSALPPLDELPDPVEFVHSTACLLQITWFDQPFTGAYERLLFFPAHYMADDFIDSNSKSHVQKYYVKFLNRRYKVS